jgi:hypothetical protein
MTSNLLAFNIGDALFSLQPGAKKLTNNTGSLISSVLPNILVVAGVIFFLLILFGGFGLVIGAGKESSPQAAAKAKDAVTFGVIGFLLVLSAYFILQIVSTLTGVNLINANI